MIISFLVAFYLQIIHPRIGFDPISTEGQLILGVTITTFSWMIQPLLSSGIPQNIFARRLFFKAFPSVSLELYIYCCKGNRGFLPTEKLQVGL